MVSSSHIIIPLCADAPVFLSLEVEPGEEVINGSMVTLTCDMDGFPIPNIMWLHNGMEVREMGIRPLSQTPGSGNVHRVSLVKKTEMLQKYYLCRW